jgi:hypothetical protein
VSADEEDVVDSAAPGDAAELGQQRMARANRVLPQVLADAATAGFSPRVDFELYEWGDVAVRVEDRPGHQWGGTDGRLFATSYTEAELLVGIADEVQEATMEGDQVHCRVWPVCPDHTLGGHALVVHGVAVWWCNGGAGHVIATIGGLERP